MRPQRTPGLPRAPPRPLPDQGRSPLAKGAEVKKREQEKETLRKKKKSDLLALGPTIPTTSLDIARTRAGSLFVEFGRVIYQVATGVHF